jgi:hypothetical protein
MFSLTEQVRLETPLGLEEVRQRLAERLVAPAGFVDSIFRGAGALTDPNAEQPEGMRFAGTVSENTFQLIRWVPYRNSFRPKIRGRFSPGGQGTIVEIQMRLPPFVIVAAVAWVLALSVAAFMWSSDVDLSFPPEAILPVALCLILTLVFAVGPKIEARKARVGIARIVGAVSEDGAIDTAP